ncbi:MAG: HAMP domain-containing protein, partial [Prochloraceae cyanobacterium]
MKISHKLTGGFLAIAFLLGSIGFITASLSYKVEMNTKRVVKDEVGDSKNHILLGNNLQELRFKIIEIWILRQHDRSIESQKKEIARILEESFSALNFNINKHENILKDLKKISSQDNTDIKTIEDAIQEIEQSVQIKEKLEIIKTKNELYLKLLDDRKIAEAYQLQSTELIPYLNDLISDSVEEHSGSYLEELNEKINYILKELRGNRNIIYSSTFIALIISLILGKYLSKSISQPINRLRKAALEVGEGNLNNRVNITTKDEIGELAICFDRMVEGLKETTVSKFYLDKILASMLDSLIVVDLDGTIQTVNHATCHLLGYSKKELIG